MTTVTAVVPAAGASTRFGSPKLVAGVDGLPLLQRTLAALLDAGVARIVVVTRAGAAFPTVPALADPRVTTIDNPDPARGMFSSIQTGLAVAGGDVVLVLPADMPFVVAATIEAVAARAVTSGAVIVPTHAGRRGHPLAIPRSLCARLAALAPETTLKDALASAGASRLEMEVDDPGVVHDVDVPDDLTRQPRA